MKVVNKQTCCSCLAETLDTVEIDPNFVYLCEHCLEQALDIIKASRSEPLKK